MNSTENIFQHINELREQLNISKKNRSTSWEEDVAKLVGLVANDFISQKDHVIALREASLITLAASCGNKHAKKRVLKPSLWLSICPPSINHNLEHQDEKCAAIKLLSHIKSEWTRTYILDELLKCNHNDVRINLLDWLIKITNSGYTFIESINSVQENPLETTEESWALEVLEYLTTQISKKKLQINHDFISGLSKFLFKQIAKLEKLDKIQIKTLELINQASYLKPAIIYSTQTASLLSMFESNRSTKDKNAIELVKRIETKILDINKSIVSIKKSDMDVITRSLHSSLQKISIQYKDSLLSTELIESQDGNINDHETENIVVSLISNWDEYIENQEKTAAIEQLSAKFDLLLDKFSITKFSSSGTVESYDPIKHELISNSNPLDVLVIKSGYGKLRSDGSIRILIKAIAQ